MNWTMVNGMDPNMVNGYPFTRRCFASGNLSVLDLFIVYQEKIPHTGDKTFLDQCG